MTFEEWWNTKDYPDCCLLRCKRAFNEGRAELEKENEQLRADYDKQKEINKELVDDIADLHKRIRELETQIKQMNEQEARDIRTRFPC